MYPPRAAMVCPVSPSRDPVYHLPQGGGRGLGETQTSMTTAASCVELKWLAPHRGKGEGTGG